MLNNRKLLWVAIGILIVINISTYSNQKSMNNNLLNTISNLNHQISSLNHQVSSQTNNINQSLSRFFEEQKIVSDGNYKFLDVDTSTGKVKTKVSWSFRELALDSDVYLLYGEKQSQPQSVENWNSVKIDGGDSTNYEAEVYLSPEKDYSFRVQWENGITSKSDELMDIPLNGIIQQRINLMPAMYGQRGPRYEHHVYVMNHFNGFEFLKIKSAKADIYVKGKLENTVILHKASDEDLETDDLKKMSMEPNTEIWLNDRDIWVNGEENWVEGRNNSWTYKGGGSPPEYFDVRVEITIIDNMGVTYKKTFGQGY